MELSYRNRFHCIFEDSVKRYFYLNEVFSVHFLLCCNFSVLWRKKIQTRMAGLHESFGHRIIATMYGFEQ